MSIMSALSGAQHLAGSAAPRSRSTSRSTRDAYRVLGYRQCGERAVRVDILERLADLIRPALAWRETSPGNKPAGAFDGRGFVVTQAMTSLTGSAGEDFASILRALGYRMEKPPAAAAEAGGGGGAVPLRRRLRGSCCRRSADGSGRDRSRSRRDDHVARDVAQDNVPQDQVAQRQCAVRTGRRRARCRAETSGVADVTAAEPHAAEAAPAPVEAAPAQAPQAEAPQAEKRQSDALQKRRRLKRSRHRCRSCRCSGSSRNRGRRSGDAGARSEAAPETPAVAGTGRGLAARRPFRRAPAAS